MLMSRIAGCTAVTLLFLAHLTAPAAASARSAAIDVVRVSAHTGKNSASEKRQQATCPHGKRVVGGGAAIEGGSSGQAPDARAHVVLTRLQPVPARHHGGRSSFEAAAHEDGDGFPGAWRLRVYAVCTGPLPGLTYRQAAAPPASAITAAEMVSCPAGKVVLGGGGRIDGGGGQVALTEHGLQTDNAFATAYEDENGFAGRWKLTAYAVCADPPPGHDVQIAGRPQMSSASSKTAVVACQDPAQRVLGAGIGNGGKENQVLPTALVPHADQKGATGTATEDRTGFAGAWDLDMFLVCVD
ncbi:hypothetical protein [Nonomuraea zeae]|uniref:Uncharacterized protein n=1 Tax=Nonomuraea zeae TaxID=1642303 RepID=A0A5S4GMK0_9ACTN|nr:hypothetical protein [Nonomuraea zeae]TMR34137.1 hypothetical protein ETD85_17685 [Nonomuraea zeae]